MRTIFVWKETHSGDFCGGVVVFATDLEDARAQIRATKRECAALTEPPDLEIDPRTLYYETPAPLFFERPECY